MELASNDLEEVSSTAQPVGRPVDEEHTTDTIERKRLPAMNTVPRGRTRPDEPSEDFVIVDLATAARPLPVEAIEEAHAAGGMESNPGQSNGDTVERMIE